MDALDTQRILLVGNQNDPLHSGYTYTIRDEAGVEYPSTDHYSYIQTLLQLGLYHQVDVIVQTHSMQIFSRLNWLEYSRFTGSQGETITIRDLHQPVGTRCKCTGLHKTLHCAKTVSKVALDVIRQHMPPGVTWDAMANYIRACRESFIAKGLRFRLQADPLFEKCLTMTGDSLLIVCDPNDTDFAIGLDEATFKIWRQNKGIQPSTLLRYIQQPAQCPDLMIGRNKLGMLLMQLRDAIRTSRAKSLRSLKTEEVDGLILNEQVICLTGIFRPLSNAYATPVFVRRKLYRSVEHYVYEKLLRKVGAPRRNIHQIRCTVDPGIVWRAACKVIKHYAENNQLSESTFNKAWKKLDKWYEAAMNAKIEQFPTLRRLLLATGDALLIETHHSFDQEWTFGSDEFEVGHLLSKRYMSSKQLYTWMKSEDDYPQTMSHLGKNKTGCFLMKLRQKLFAESDPTSDESDANLSLVKVADMSFVAVSSHMLCFTPESVFHPLHPIAIQVDNVQYHCVEHYVRIMANRYFAMKLPSDEALEESKGSNNVAVCWAEYFAQYFPPVDKLFAWEYTELVETYRRGMRACFEQHPTLLRALLDTGDCLLVYCNRWFSDTCEWSCGMRESDLRLWMDLTRVSTNALVQLCTLPLAKRPAFLGGNRLGFLLMELRREFMSRGMFAHTLPELTMPSEQVLGSDSPTESMHLFDVFSTVPTECDYDYNASVWISPLVIAARRTNDDDLWARVGTRPKTDVPDSDEKPVEEVPPEEAPEETELEGQPVMKEPENPHADLEAMDDTQLKNVLMDIVVRLRHMTHANTMQERKITFLRTEISRVRGLRQTMSELLEQNMKDEKPGAEPTSKLDEASIDTINKTSGDDSVTSNDNAPFVIPTESQSSNNNTLDTTKDSTKSIWDAPCSQQPTDGSGEPRSASADEPKDADSDVPFAGPVVSRPSADRPFDGPNAPPSTISATQQPFNISNLLTKDDKPAGDKASEEESKSDNNVVEGSSTITTDALKLFQQPLTQSEGDIPVNPESTKSGDEKEKKDEVLETGELADSDDDDAKDS